MEASGSFKTVYSACLRDRTVPYLISWNVNS